MRINELEVRRRILQEYTTRETAPTYPYGLEWLNEPLYLKNVQLLQQFHSLLAQSDPQEAADRKQSWYPVLDVPPTEALGYARGIRAAADISHFVTQTTERETRYAKKAAHPRVCPIFATHTEEYYLLHHIARFSVPLPQIGILAADHHLDLRVPHRDGKIRKNAVYTHLLRDGVAGVGFIGVPQPILTAIEEETPEEDPSIQSEIASVRRRYRDRTFFSRGVTPTGIDQAALAADIDPMIAGLKKNGATHLWTPIDLDVFAVGEQKVSATSYNPAATIAALGLQDLTQAAQDLLGADHAFFHALRFRGQTEITQAMELLEIFDCYHELTAHQDTILYPAATTPTAFRGTKVYGQDASGFDRATYTAVLTEIRAACNRHGLTVGLPFGKATVPGAIYEAVGNDYHGNTASLITFCMQELKRSAA